MGLPMGMRSTLWPLFLGVHSQAQPGYYRHLVGTALGEPAAAELQAAGADACMRRAAHASSPWRCPNWLALPVAPCCQVCLLRPSRTELQSILHIAVATRAMMRATTVRERQTPRHAALPVLRMSGSQHARRDEPKLALTQRAHAQRLKQATLRRGAGKHWSRVQAALDQIDKDLGRTFPDAATRGRCSATALRRVLAAFAAHCPAIGYCQGLNFLAGALLLAVPEEAAFWCLKRIAEGLLPGYFTESMAGAVVDRGATRAALAARFPTVLAKAAALQVDVPMVAAQWCARARAHVAQFAAGISQAAEGCGGRLLWPQGCHTQPALSARPLALEL